MKKGGKVGIPGRNSPNVIQSEAKNLDDTHVNVSEILRFALDDI